MKTKGKDMRKFEVVKDEFLKYDLKKEKHLKSLTFKFMDNKCRLDGIVSTTQDSVNVSFHSAHHAKALIIA